MDEDQPKATAENETKDQEMTDAKNDADNEEKEKSEAKSPT